MNETERERLRGRLEELDDEQLIVDLLALHKTIEVQAHGRQRELLEAETTTLSAALQRLVDPVTLDTAMHRFKYGGLSPEW